MPHPERHSEARRSLQPGEGSGAHHRCRVPPTSVFPSEPALLHAPSVIPKPGVFSSRARDLACTTDDECPNVCSPQRSLRCCTPRASSRSPALSPAGRGIWHAAPMPRAPNVGSPQRSLRCCTSRASSQSPAFSPAGRGIWRAPPMTSAPTSVLPSEACAAAHPERHPEARRFLQPGEGSGVQRHKWNARGPRLVPRFLLSMPRCSGVGR